MQICQKFKILYNKIITEPAIISVIFIVALTFTISVLLQIIGIQEYKIFQEYKSLLFLVVIVIQNLILLAPIAIYLRPKEYKEALAIKKFTLIKSSLLIVLGFAIFFLVNYLVIWIETELGLNIAGYGEQMDYLPLFGDDKYSIPVSIFSLAILAPFAEEILFRGYLFTEFNKSYSSKTTVFLSSIIFAAFHLQPEVFLPLFILGLILGTLRQQSNSIWPAIIFHVINNSLALAVEFIA